MKKSVAILLVLLFVLAACAKPEAAHDHASATGHDHAAAPAAAVNPNAALADTVLNPNHMPDLASQDSYRKAKEVADRLDKMYCYCHCKENEGHKSLLTCFQTNHAASCIICMQEATMAWIDWKKGLTVEETIKAVDAQFGGGVPRG
jgi:hypothetical protein